MSSHTAAFTSLQQSKPVRVDAAVASWRAVTVQLCPLMFVCALSQAAFLVVSAHQRQWPFWEFPDRKKGGELSGVTLVSISANACLPYYY
ncbi:hypothetical protein AOLI_G00151930 [Acnodon oligacanthus]